MVQKPRASWAGNNDSTSSHILSFNQVEKESLKTNGESTCRFEHYGSKDWKDINMNEQTEHRPTNDSFVVFKRSQLIPIKTSFSL